MVVLEKILDEAIEREASDIHIICGLKPVLRINKSLIPAKINVITESDIYNAYDYIIKGNVLSDNEFKKNRRLDTSLTYKETRMRVNISNSDGIPVFTIRIINDVLPSFEELGIPEIVRKMTYMQQGLILITGKTNSGKSTTLNSLINYINEKQNKKILTLEAPIEYKHKPKKSIIIQKEVGNGSDSLTFIDGVSNALREDCDILVIGEIRDKYTMEAAIDMAEAGHLVIGTLHTKSCAETVDRIINLYDFKDQAQIKYLLSSILKLVVSQRLLKSADNTKLVLIPEVMVVDNIVSSCIRKEKFSVSEIEDAIQGGGNNGSMSLINALALAVINKKITLEQAEKQLELKNIELLKRTTQNLTSKGN
ncbi:MAG: PilT/PilU family type 4a pilus ATPase [Clostridia bacterium]|nr:PilT/PilU family type 4a pilus ATPase [Clostridia bacterium]